jgi:hypothetical protein
MPTERHDEAIVVFRNILNGPEKEYTNGNIALIQASISIRKLIQVAARECDDFHTAF